MKLTEREVWLRGMREGVTEDVTPVTRSVTVVTPSVTSVTKSVTCAECVRLRAKIVELEGMLGALLARVRVAKTGVERMREYRKRKREGCS
jgi:hypothetical protein